jgi:RNA polymerase sigma-70 factor (ECF subfamily)
MTVPRSTTGQVATALSPNADISLLQRIAVRDEAALASLYDRHNRLLYSLIVRILRSPLDAEDVLQETFVRVWTRADTYDSRLGSPVAWLVRIARNRAIDRRRAMNVRESVVSDSGSTEPPSRRPEPVTTETPEARAQAHATAHAIRDALAMLTSGQRELIEAAFFEGYTHWELSARFGLPLGTVKTRIRAGLSAMRGRLEQVV